MRWALGVLWLLVSSAVAGAHELEGEYTNLLFGTDNSQAQRVYSDLNRLRVHWHGEHGPWSWSVRYDQEFWLGGLLRDPLYRAALATPEPTWLNASATLASGRAYVWRHALYRGWLRFERGAWQGTLGRQRIAWGSGRIWNPTDRFNPIQPTALETEQKLGVDALRVRWRYSGFGGLDLVLAPGKASYGVSRKWALRWADMYRGQDLAVLVGGMGDEHVAGLDLTGNIGDAGYRLEGMQSWGGARGAHVQCVVGVDGTWRTRVLPNGLYLALEYFYNGDPRGYSLHATDYLQGSSHQLLGALAGYDLTALWRLDLMLLADLERTGLFFAPRLRWSAKENLDLDLLAQWPGGRGAFAVFARTLALQLKWYF